MSDWPTCDVYGCEKRLVAQWDDGATSDPTGLREDMGRPDVTLTPVLREDTPFGSDDE